MKGLHTKTRKKNIFFLCSISVPIFFKLELIAALCNISWSLNYHFNPWIWSLHMHVMYLCVDIYTNTIFSNFLIWNLKKYIYILNVWQLQFCRFVKPHIYLQPCRITQISQFKVLLCILLVLLKDRRVILRCGHCCYTFEVKILRHGKVCLFVSDNG